MPASTCTCARLLAAARAAVPALLLALAASCGAGHRSVASDPFFASFYETTRLIMTDEEVQIYRHLADAGAREEFIEEFWQKRDPLPDTPENEARDEFARRIAYANRWFRENRAAGRGWDTPRGRILIQLGEPDNRYLNEMINDPNVKGVERWIYYEYQLELVFVDSAGFGEYKLRNWPPELLSAIDHARFAVNPVAGGAKTPILSFRAGHRDGLISIAVPLKRVRFSEAGEAIQADLRVTVYVYRDYAKVDTRVFDKRLQYPRGGLPAGRDVEFSLPLTLQAKGRYFLDVIVQDLLTGSRARDFVAFRL